MYQVTFDVSERCRMCLKLHLMCSYSCVYLQAETVLSKRAGRLTVVLEAVYDVRNVHAVLRTCDCLGVQHVWVVEPITFKVQ